MKRYLLFILQFLTLAVAGQGIQVVEQRRQSNNEVLYLATTIRDTAVYPLTTSGLSAFKTAVANKALSLTVNCPNGSQTVYAVGATLPSVPACAALNTTLLNAQYTYNIDTRSLDIETAPASGSALTLKIEPVQGGIVAVQSPASQTIGVGQFTAPASLTGQGTFTQQWGYRAIGNIARSGIPQLPYRLTWKRTSDNATFSYVFIPTPGTRKALFTAANSSPPPACDYTVAATGGSVICDQGATLTAMASGTAATGLTYTWSGNGFTGSGPSVGVTPPAVNGTYSYTVSANKTGCTAKTATAAVVVTGCSSGTTVARTYPKVLFWDNSIGFHPPVPAWGWNNSWGMAATAVNKDYRHLLLDKLRLSNTSTTAYAMGTENNANGITGIGGQVTVATGPDWEANYHQRNYDDYSAVFAVAPDLLVFKIGENVDDTQVSARNFKQKTKDLLGRFKAVKANVQIVIATPVWDKPNTTAILKQIAAEDGYPLWDGSVLVGQSQYFAGGVYPDAGVNAHPDDDGMLAIANGIFDKIPTTGSGAGPGPGTAPLAGYGGLYGPNSQYVALPETGRQGSGEVNGQYNRLYIDNGQLRIGMNLTLGGAMDYVSLPSMFGGKNQINSPIYNYPNGKVDAGRQVLWSWYGYPNGGEEGKYNDPIGGMTWGGIGWNIVEAGNEGQNPAYGELFTMHKSADGFYVKNAGRQWEIHGTIPGQIKQEKWVKFDQSDPKAFRMHSRLTMERTDPQGLGHFPTGRIQEAPCYMSVANYDRIYYCNGRPYTGQWDSQVVPQLGPGPVNFWSNEPFVIAIDSETGSGFAFYTQFLRFNKANDKQDSDNSNDYNFNLFYLSSAPILSLDPRGVYDTDIGVKYGTLAELRTWAYNQPRMSGTFNYVFNQKSRLACFYHHAQDQLEANITSGLHVKPILNDGFHNGRDMKMMVPEKWIDGRTVKHVYIKMAVTGGSPNMALTWKRLGANLEQLSEYTQNFTVINDGQMRVIDIDLSNNAEWVNKDIIGFEIKYQYPYPDVANVDWHIQQISSSPAN